MDAKVLITNTSINYPCIELISKHIVRPSSSSSSSSTTPQDHQHHLKKTLKLSVFDQLAPPLYVPTIFFYENRTENQFNDEHRAHISHKLRESLSNILKTFYPLTGKLDADKCSVTVDFNECPGVEMTETRVHARLSDVMANPNVEELLQGFLPLDVMDNVNTDFLTDVMFSVQVNFFDCGGFAIGICMSHKIADAASIFMFMNSWANTCREGPKSSSDDDDMFGVMASRFPASVDLQQSFRKLRPLLFSMEGDKVSTLTTKRFVFDKEKLAALRASATTTTTPSTHPDDDHHQEIKDPTRVELVSAFIWKNLATTMLSKKGRKRAHVAAHAVNFRKRTNNAQHAFGNFVFLAFALGDGDNVQETPPPPTMDDLVRKLRHAIRTFSLNADEFLKKIEKGDLREMVGQLDSAMQAAGNMEMFGFTSWCRFRAYEADFGWGKPVWITPSNNQPIKGTFFMDSKCGEGIEAWINVPHREDMKDLEIQFQLLGTN